MSVPHKSAVFMRVFVLCAHLKVKLSFSVEPWNANTKEIFFSDGKVARTEKMKRCVMECHSKITTDETVYSSQLVEAQEWPLDWPVTPSFDRTESLAGSRLSVLRRESAFINDAFCGMVCSLCKCNQGSHKANACVLSIVLPQDDESLNHGHNDGTVCLKGGGGEVFSRQIIGDDSHR